MRKNHLTLIEFVAIIAVLVCLCAILTPVYIRARDSARVDTCQSNLWHLAMAVRMYQNDWNGGMPSSFTGNDNEGYTLWPHFLSPYLKKMRVFRCPADECGIFYDNPDGHSWMYISYSINSYVSASQGYSGVRDAGSLAYLNICYTTAQKGQIRHPEDVFLMWCGGDTSMDTDHDVENYHMMRIDKPDGFPSPRHNDGTNYAFCDGHVKWLPMKDVPDTDRRFFIH